MNNTNTNYLEFKNNNRGVDIKICALIILMGKI